MKLKDIRFEEDLVERYKKYIDSLLDTEIDDLSNSDLSFIKLVAPSSIHSMKKKGKLNLYILTHSQKEVSENSKKEKAKKLLSSMSREELLNFLSSNGFVNISRTESES